MPRPLTPQTWAGHNINDYDPVTNTGNYQAVFNTRTQSQSAVHASPPSQTVTTERPAEQSVYVDNQPQSRPIEFDIIIRPDLPDEYEGQELHELVDQLKAWFGEAGSQYLVAIDSNEVQRRKETAYETLVPQSSTKHWHVTLRDLSGTWESVTPVTASATLTATGQQVVLNNAGSAPTKPKFTITPRQIKTGYWAKRRRIHHVNQAIDKPLHDPNGGYPMDVTGGGLNTAGMAVKANLDDLRLLVNGRDQDRWPEPATPDAASAIWANMRHSTPKVATLGLSIDADDTTVVLNNTRGASEWEDSGFLLLGTERLQYVKVTDFDLTVVRGTGNTTAAAHTLGATLWFVEHSYVDLIYDYTGAGEAPASEDTKPLFDLTQSSNSSWFWPGPFFVPVRTLRTGGFYRYFSADNPGSEFMRCYESGGLIVFDNSYPAAGRPRANNAEIGVPCGLSLSGAAIVFTQSITGVVPIEGFGWRRIVTVSTYTFTLLSTGTVIVEYDGAGEVIDVYEYETYELQPTGVSTVEASSTFPVARGSDLSIPLHGLYQVGENVTIREAPSGREYIFTQPRYERPVVMESETSYQEERGIISSAALNPLVYVTDREGYEAFLPVGTSLSLSREAFRVRLNVNPPIGLDKEGEEFETIPESARDTGASVSWDDIRLNFDTTRIPQVYIAPEEALYLYDLRITHEESGEFIDLRFPSALDNPLIVDCEAQTVVDSETGLEVPWAMGGKWLSGLPGENTYTFDEAGLADVDVTIEAPSKWN